VRNGSAAHDDRAVARLTYDSDPLFNALVYGKDAVAAEPLDL